MYWQRRKTIEERFWEKVLVGDADECWPWQGSLGPHGRGRIYYGPNRKIETAPRVAYMLMRGDIPEGLYVLHKCDNPRCVNPKHLFAGTQEDNVKDMIAKGRRPKLGQKGGESHPMAKLTKEQVLMIRSLKEQGLQNKSLAAHFGVSAAQIARIVNGARWP